MMTAPAPHGQSPSRRTCAEVGREADAGGARDGVAGVVRCDAAAEAVAGWRTLVDDIVEPLRTWWEKGSPFAHARSSVSLRVR